MTQQKQIYRCNVCGNIVEVLHAGAGELVCCGETMELLEEKKEDTGQEKHVPVIEKGEDATRVKVGSIAHPMEERHYIEWIELITENNIYRKFLHPGEKPEAEFQTKDKILKAREYCNVHGLWSN